MSNFFKNHSFNYMVAIIAAISFTFSVLKTSDLIAYNENINFETKIEKILYKINNCLRKNEINKFTSYIFEIKSEIEQYTGYQIDTDTQIDKAEKKARENNQDINPLYIKEVKKYFSKQDNKNKMIWFSESIESDEIKKQNEKDMKLPENIKMFFSISMLSVLLLLVHSNICNEYAAMLVDISCLFLCGNIIYKLETYYKCKII